MNKKIKIAFSLIGLLSFIRIIESYGLGVIQEEIQRSGFLLVLIILTFIPTLLCYSVSWLLVTEHHLISGNFSTLKKIVLFTKFTTISIAWNNLTPFLKVGGEPLKYLMLKDHLTRKEAITSTINYNIIHLLSTVLSFIIGAFFLMAFYPISSKGFLFSMVLILFFCFAFFMSATLVKQKIKKSNSGFGHHYIRLAYINLFVIKKRLMNFYVKYPRAFLLSLFFDTSARFIEGLTFYFGFQLIKKPITLFSAAFLDIGRTLADTIFFFIPYQVGTREQSVHFFMEKVLLINSSGFLTVVLYYRFVEIVWIVIGYLIWFMSNKDSSVETV